MAVKNITEKERRRDEFIGENLPLVHSLAHRYAGKGVEYDDLYAAGCVGLVKAYDGFDESRGYNFSTYAVPVILGEIKRLFRDGGQVKVSRSIKDMSLKIVAVRTRLEHELMRSPTVGEIASAMNVSAEEVAAAAQAQIPAMSLTADDEDKEGVRDIPSDYDEEKQIMKIALKSAIEKLSGNDRRLIYLRYFCDMTQSQTAKELSMTQVSVSRREKYVLNLMRQQLL